MQGLNVTVLGIAAMVTRLYQHTFPGDPIPGGSPPPAACPSAFPPFASTVVEVGDSDEDSEEGIEGESDFDLSDDDDDGGVE